MSHFTVLVIGGNIEAQMAPYEESTQNPEYRTFKSTEQEDMIEYMTGTMTLVTLPDGTTTNEYDSKYRVFEKNSFDSKYVFPEGTIKEEKTFNQVFKTFEEYKREWCSIEERDPEMGEYGYWHNENAQWDWYSLGGRWMGYFKPKAGTTGKLGRAGAFNNKPKEGWVDTIQMKDIDTEGMLEESIKEANETYDKIESILNGRPLPSWNAIREKNGENIEAARIEYDNLETVQDFNNAKFYIGGDFVETFCNSREEYIEKCKNQTMVPFAVVKDGQWYQKGKMGWWGMSTDEMTQEEWNKTFWDMIKSLDPETELTLLDCHI